MNDHSNNISEEQNVEQGNSTSYGVNRCMLRGVIKEISSGKTNTGIEYVNLVLTVPGMRYTENIPCVAYGKIAEAISQEVGVGDRVFATARIREQKAKDKSYIVIVIRHLDKAI